MTSFSKFFTDKIQNKTCQELYHPWTSSCHRAWLEVFLSIMPGAVKLLLPSILVPLLYNARDSDYSCVKKSLIVFVKILLNAFGTVMTTFYVMCLLNQVLGKFYVPTIVLLPIIIVSPLSFILPLLLRKKHSQIFFNFVLEATIKNSEYPAIKALRNSKIFTTLIFMCISGTIMYYLKKDKYPVCCWFIQPTKRNFRSSSMNNNAGVSFKRYIENPEFPGWGQLKLTEKLCCDHNDLCDKYALDGFLTYGKFGIGLEIIKRIVSSIGLIKTNPLEFLRHIVVTTNYKFVKFMVAYGVLYRISNCFFNRKFGEETAQTSLLAGIVAGVAFACAPNYYFFTYGFSTMVQLMWHALGTTESLDIPHFKKLYNLPWSVIIYGIFGGLMVHIRLFKPQLLPKLAVIINDMMSNGHTKRISERIQALALETV